MLGKLIKYDLKPMLKFISVFYILGIVFAILTRIFFSVENSLMINILGQITTGATISMLISILINNTMRLWVRFKNTLYDDESYLTHTLPVDKKNIYLSKFFSSLITLFISFVVAIIIMFIAYYSKENLELLKNLLLPLANILNIDLIKLILILIFVVFLELFSIIMSGYLGIIIGHKFNNKKVLLSVVFGFMVYSITQICVLLIILIYGLFNNDILSMFTSSNINDISLLLKLCYLSILSYLVLIIVNMFISIKVLKKGVNVD